MKARSVQQAEKPWKQIRDEVFMPEEQTAHDEEAKRIIAELPLAQLERPAEFDNSVWPHRDHEIWPHPDLGQRLVLGVG